MLDHLLVSQCRLRCGRRGSKGFSVDEIIVEDGRVTGIRGHGKGGRIVSEHSRIVVGADGRNSLVARAIKPDQYHEKPKLMSGYYTYWSWLLMNGRFETYIRPDRAFAGWPRTMT